MKTNRPLILLLLAAVLPLLILSGIIGAISLKQEQASMEQDAQARTRLVATMIERALDGQVSILSGITHSPRFDKASPNEFVSFFERIREGQPQWMNVKLTDPAGRVLATTPAAKVPHEEVLDPESHSLAVATGKPVVGSVMKDLENRIGYAIRAPILRDGKVIGVISAVVNPAGVTRMLATDELPRGWRAVVVDRAGRIVALTGLGTQPESRAAKASRQALEARAKSPAGFYEGLTPAGLHNLSAYQTIPRYGWSVHVLIPLDLYRAPIQRAVVLVIVCGGLGLLLVGLFLTLLARELGLRRKEEAAAEQARRIESLGRITGGVAHDFNNILMIVQGSAEMMKRRAHDPERVAAMADTVLTASRRGQALTRQLLAFARRGAHEPAAFSLRVRIEEVAELLERAVGDSVEVEVQIPADVWPVFADPHGFEIALINLAVNARDAMPNGGRLALAAANVILRPERGASLPLKGEFVAVTVRDTGSGIPEEHLAHVFEPFFTTKAPGKGTGLGLSQVYGFAQQSGGAATVTSRAGHGAAFTLYLPRAHGLAVVPPERRTAEAVGQGRLLVVDDDPHVRETTAAMMEAAGYTVLRADSPAGALDLLASGEAVDAVLSDIVMPGGLSGLELADRLRALHPDLPVVLMTGYSEALSDGGSCAWPVVFKPFAASEAVAALGLARKRAA